MKNTLTWTWQIVLFLAVFVVASPLALAQTAPQLQSFTTGAVVDLKADATALAGEFTTTSSIDPANEAVTLTVDTATSVTFPKGSFKKGFFGAYQAGITSGTIKAGMLLYPLKGGKWVYSAAIEGFSSPSTSVTVGLDIGGAAGSATGKAFVFPKH